MCSPSNQWHSNKNWGGLGSLTRNQDDPLSLIIGIYYIRMKKLKGMVGNLERVYRTPLFIKKSLKSL